MSIGSVYYFDYKLTSGMSEILEAWENTLETNDDGFTVIDNEEGDYGIIRYLDSNGVEMLTKVVQAGDIENTYFTDAGADAVRKLMLDNFNDILGAALTAGMPTAGDLKAHEPRKVRVFDLDNEQLRDDIGSYDLFIFKGLRFLPFSNPNNRGMWMFWCAEESKYLLCDVDLHQTPEQWRQTFADNYVTIGEHRQGLSHLLNAYDAVSGLL